MCNMKEYKFQVVPFEKDVKTLKSLNVAWRTAKSFNRQKNNKIDLKL